MRAKKSSGSPSSTGGAGGNDRTAPSEDSAAWSIVGYLISGLLIWGGIGYGLDQWWHTHFALPAGLLLGAGASLYLIWLRYGRS